MSKKRIVNIVLTCITITCIALAYSNNRTFTNIATKEYEVMKQVISEKLKKNYPDSITVIMPEENFLVTQKQIKNVVTDEFGKLSNSVDWAAKTMPLQLIYELTNDKPKATTIKVNAYYRNKLPKIVVDTNWLLDVEIFLKQ